MKRFYIDDIEVSQQEFERRLCEGIRNEVFSIYSEEENREEQDQAIENAIYNFNHGEWSCLIDYEEFQSKEE